MYWTISPDLRWIAYYERERPALGRISKEGDIQDVARIDVPFSEAKFSPDSAKILLMNMRGELWVADVPEVGRKRLVYQDTTVYGMEWSPDSRWIAVVGADFRTRVVDLEGRVQPGVVPAAPYGKIRARHFSWCPGGRLVYAEESDDDMILWEIDVTSGKQYVLATSGSRGFPFCSPNGAYIAITGTIKGGTLETKILDRSGKEILSSGVPTLDGGGGYYWSPDGRKFAVGVRQKDEGDRTYRDYISVLIIPEGEVIYLPGDYAYLLGWTSDSQAVILSQYAPDEMLIRLPLSSAGR